MNYDIKTVDDVLNHANQIIEKVENDPMNYQMVTLNSPSGIDVKIKNCIGGSSAIKKLAELLIDAQKDAYNRGSGVYLPIINNIEPNDTDVFILGSNERSRTKYSDVDIVHKTEKTAEKLLEWMDLPMCQVVYTNIQNQTVFFASYHCLYSLLTGHFFLPKYVKNNKIFSQRHASIVDKVFDSFQQRVEKYQERGYICRYVYTDEDLPWIKNSSSSSYY